MRLVAAVSALSLVSVLAMGATLAGCAKQGVGEYCSTTNNNDDCQDGLICSTQDVCCPPTNANCGQAVTTTPTDGGVADTFTPTDAVSEASEASAEVSEASAEVGSDAADSGTITDASTDSPADAGDSPADAPDSPADAADVGETG